MLIPLLLALSATDASADARLVALASEAERFAPSPQAAAYLIRLEELTPWVADAKPIGDTFARIAQRKDADRQVRDLAAMLLGRLEFARGRDATLWRAPLGFIQDWYLVGSFSNEGKGGCDTDFGPEAKLDITATYPASGRDVAWRKVIPRAPDGYVDMASSLQPSNDAVGYAATVLGTASATDAEISFGTSGAYRLWLNGLKVASSDKYHAPREDQQRLKVRLPKGRNTILLKVCQSQGAYGFFFRAVASKGTLATSVPDVFPANLQGAKVTVEPNLASRLGALADRKPADGSLRMAAARVSAYLRDGAEEERQYQREAERAATAAPTDAEVLAQAALLHPEDLNERREYLRQALRVSPDDESVRIAHAEVERDARHPELALAEASSVLAKSPASSKAWILKVRSLDEMGERVASVLAAEDALRAAPRVPEVILEAARASDRAGRPLEELSRLRAYLAILPGDTAVRRHLGAKLAAVGDMDGAIAEYLHVVRDSPFDIGALMRAGELQMANRHRDEARATFARARELSPDDAARWEREGHALSWDPASRDAALQCFENSLALRPQNAALREAIGQLRGADALQVGSAALSSTAILAAAQAAQKSSAAAVVLADVTQVRVQRSGLASRFRQVAVLARNDAGANAWRNFSISFSPDRESVAILKARVMRADGSVLGGASERTRSLNEPWSAMYYDAQARVLTFSALGPGDIVEIQYRVDDTATDNLLADYWGDFVVLQGVSPVMNYQYQVQMPPGRALYWNAKQLPPYLTQHTTKDGAAAVYTFAAREIPAINPEPFMPNGAETSAVIHLSTFSNWADVGRTYEALVRDQLVPNDAIRGEVEEVLRGVDRNDARAVVAALYRFVVSSTRYVALEFGVHGYRPYRVDQVLARRFGDCKDKASLLLAMLGVAGIDSRLVLVRTRNLGTISPEVASLSAFNHAIVYVPTLDLYLDGTADFYGSNALPAGDQGASVLVVEPDGKSRFLTTPEFPGHANSTFFQFDISLDDRGTAVGRGKVVATGDAAAAMRRTYESPATRMRDFEQELAEGFPFARVSQVTLSDPRALENPTSLGFSATLPRYAEAGGGLLRFAPLGAPRTIAQKYAPLVTRAFALALPDAWLNRFEFAYSFPGEWDIPELPPPVKKVSPFGTVSLTYRREGGKLLVGAEVLLAKSRVAVADYPHFRAWLLDVDNALSRKIQVRLTGGRTQADAAQSLPR